MLPIRLQGNGACFLGLVGPKISGTVGFPPRRGGYITEIGFEDKRYIKNANVCSCVVGRTVSRDGFAIRISGVSSSQVHGAVVGALQLYSYYSSRRIVSDENGCDIGYIDYHFVNAVTRLLSGTPLFNRDIGTLWKTRRKV